MGLMSFIADRMDRSDDMERQRLAREKVQTLMGSAQSPYRMSEEELFPGESPQQAVGAQWGGPTGLMNKGSGYLGQMTDPREIEQAKLYGGLMGTQGYESIGAQGLMNIQNNRNAMLKNQLSGELTRSKDSFKNEGDLRKQYVNQTQDFVKVRDANNRISAAAQNPTAAGDMALIFNFMKVLDPGSTVREGEFATAQNTTGVDNRIMNLYNNIMTGERLNPQQRADFVGQANNLYEAQLGGLSQLEDQYTGIAQNYGLNPKNIIVDYRVKQAPKKITPPPPPKGFK